MNNISTLTTRLKKSGANRRFAKMTRLAAVIVIALFLQVAVSAYTLVLRNNRRVEIPANFTVTTAGVTYEAAPGINVTVQIQSIDVAATERANNEAVGALLRRVERHSASTQQRSTRSSITSPPRHTLTDDDLEAPRRARKLSEENYERRRVQLGLPSNADARRSREEEAEKARAELRRGEADDAQSEAYWRGRSSVLRTEIVATDAEINYIQTRLAELPNGSLFISPYALSAPVVPFVSYPFGNSYGTIFSPVIRNNTNIIGANAGAQLSGRIGFGGDTTRGSVSLNALNTNANFHRRMIVAPGVNVSPFIIASTLYPYYGYDTAYERAALIVRLRDLETTRAGLQARWRLLEDEARRAGALPGWLRP